MATVFKAKQDQISVAANPPGLSWRIWVTKHPFGGAIVAGWIATWIATIFGIWFHGIGLPDLDWPIANGAVVDPKASTAVQFSLGEFIHGGDGIVFVIIFGIFIFPALSRVVGRRVTPATNMAKAIIFSMALATISAGFLVPYVYYPHVGAGLFAVNYGWKIVFAIYLWHLAFGVNLGLIYNPLPTTPVPVNPQHDQALDRDRIVETRSVTRV